MGMTFLLEERLDVALVVGEETGHRVVTEKVEEGEEGEEVGVLKDFIAGCLSGCVVPAVGQVQCEGHPEFMVRLKVALHVDPGRQCGGVCATPEADAELSYGEEQGGKVRFKQDHEMLACCAAEGCADANGAKFGGVLGILVEGHEPVGGESGPEVWVHLVVEQKLKEVTEGGKVRQVVRGFKAGLVKSEVFEHFGEVSVWARCCARFNPAQGLEEQGLVDNDRGGVTGACVAVG